MLLKSGKILYGLHFCSSPKSAIVSSLYRFLSNSVSEPHFAVEYLINTCGVPPEKAIKASKYLKHLKSASNADSVLRFLKESGVSNAQITRAVSTYPSLLCYSVDNNIKLRVNELQEMGFSPSQIGQLVSLCPSGVGNSNMQEKIKFWMPILGSIEMLLKVLRKNNALLLSNLDKVIVPNISFLEEHYRLSICKILHQCSSDARLVTFNPSKVKEIVQRVEGLGIPCSSGLFKQALRAVSCISQSRFDEKIKFLKSLGWSEAEVSSMIRKQPALLKCSQDNIHQKLDFLSKEAGLQLQCISCYPILLMYSLDHRLIPRHYVLSTLKLKGLPEGKRSIIYSLKLSEKNFWEKFVLPFHDIISGFSETYTAGCARNVPVKTKK